jgi:hypothetical protein
VRSFVCSVSFDRGVILYDVCYLFVVSYCKPLPPGKNPFAVNKCYITLHNFNISFTCAIYIEARNYSQQQNVKMCNVLANFWCFGCSFSLLLLCHVNKVLLCKNDFSSLFFFQTCSEAFREANVASAFGKPINF